MDLRNYEATPKRPPPPLPQRPPVPESTPAKPSLQQPSLLVDTGAVTNAIGETAFVEMVGEFIHDYAMAEHHARASAAAPAADTTTMNELRNNILQHASQAAATAGNRDEADIERLLSVVMSPEDARHFAAAASDRGILSAAAPHAHPLGDQRGNAPPSGQPNFTQATQVRAAEMQHEIRAIAELGAMVLQHETAFDRLHRQAVQTHVKLHDMPACNDRPSMRYSILWRR